MTETAARWGSPAAQRGRNLVMWAFNPVGQVAGSVQPLALYSGRGRHQAPKGLKSRPRNPVEAVGLSPTLVYAKETTQAKFSVPIGGAVLIGAQDVLQAIMRLPAIDRFWINHHYRALGKEKEYASHHFGTLLWKAYSHEYLVGTRQKTRDVARHLVVIRVMESRRALYWNDRRPREIDHLICRGEMTEDTWKKTYCKHWKAIKALMLEIDERALSDVARRVRRN